MNLTSTAIKRLAMSLLLLFVIGISTLMSQTYYDRITNVQTPNVANLGVYGEIPVSPYTGTPEVSIPLYELNLKGLNFPITLSHHSGSIKPEQHVGWVGLGWTLNAGGVIYRTINGNIDELSTTSTDPYFYKQGYYFKHGLLDTDKWNNKEYLLEMAKEDQSSHKDRAPDEFSFNFLGISGKFYLSEKGKWVVQSNRPIKVEFNGKINAYPEVQLSTTNDQIPTFSGFTLIDEKGNRFLFGYERQSIEYAKPFFDQGKTAWTATSWYLTHVYLASGESVKLEYRRGPYINQLIYNYSAVMLQSKEAPWGKGGKELVRTPEWSEGIFGALIAPLYLRSITTANETIRFGLSVAKDLQTPTDVYKAYFDVHKNWKEFATCLATMGVTSAKQHPICFGLLKWMKLDSLTITSHDKSTHMGYKFLYEENRQSRLLLRTLKAIGKRTKDVELSYHFDYNRPEELPAYYSQKTDHWGYYNGRAFLGIALNYHIIKEANPAYATIGQLTRITYPTGGYTRFVFEPHTYAKNLNMLRWEGCYNEGSDKYAGGARIKEIVSSSTGKSEDEFLLHRYYYSKTRTGRSSGVCGGQFRYYYGNYKVWGYESGTWRTISVFSSCSVLPASNNSQGASVGYTDVIEENADGSYQRYHYSNFDNGHLDESFECTIQNGMETREQYAFKGQERGLLLRKQSYDSMGRLKNVETLDYEKSKQSNNYVRAMIAGSYSLSGNGPSYGEGVCYKIYTYTMLPTKRREVFFENGDSIVKQTQYKYNPRGVLQETLTTLPTNDKLRQVTTFADDMKATPTYDAMVKRHMVGVPIEQFTFRNGSLVDATLNTFKLNTKNSWPVLDKVYRGMFKLPYSKTEPVPFDGETVPQRYGEAEIQFNNYDANNNYREAIGKGGRRVVFFWQKGARQPVAIFKNAQNNRDTIYEKRADRICKGLAVECRPYAKEEMEFTTEQETEVEVEMLFPESEKDNFLMFVGVDHQTVNLLVDFRRDPQKSDRYYAKLGRILAGKHTLNVEVEYLGIEGKFDESRCSVHANVNCYYTILTPLPPRIVGYNNVFYEGFEHGRGENIYHGGFHSDWCYRGLYRARLDIDPKKRYFIDYQVYHNGYWQYKCAPFTGGEYIINENNDLIDDIRIYPEDAEVMSFNYDGRGQITSRTDQRGYTYSYRYDAFGRLVSEHDTDWNTLKRYEYHYKNQEAK